MPSSDNDLHFLSESAPDQNLTRPTDQQNAKRLRRKWEEALAF